ncbi:MAG: hypothetical protein ACHQ3P_04505 [Candidatus Limnocylindrales bacterium]
MATAVTDPDEHDVRVLAEAMRRSIAAGETNEQLETLARAVLGDDDAEEPADSARDDAQGAGTWFG